MSRQSPGPERTQTVRAACDVACRHPVRMASHKNVDATLYGYELTAHKVVTGIDTTLNLNYTRGEDDTQNRALPQIMPLAGDLTFELKSAKSNYGLRINFADTQDRFD